VRPSVNKQTSCQAWALNEPNESNPLHFPRRRVSTIFPLSLPASHKTSLGGWQESEQVLVLLPKRTNCAYLGARGQGKSERFRNADCRVWPAPCYTSYPLGPPSTFGGQERVAMPRGLTFWPPSLGRAISHHQSTTRLVNLRIVTANACMSAGFMLHLILTTGIMMLHYSRLGYLAHGIDLWGPSWTWGHGTREKYKASDVSHHVPASGFHIAS
jgi:hypothetical protein